MNVCPYCGMALQPAMRTCPSCQRAVPEEDAAAEQDEAARLEPVEEIHQVIEARRTATRKETRPDSDTVPFRPLRRPSMALLCILDDGKEDGEWVRVRSGKLVIGREEGDVRIPHDDMISTRHAELVRQSERGHYRWHLIDLQSTNGTYVRIGEALLRHGQEILIGSSRYRFEAAPQGAAESEEETSASEEKPKGTRGWQSVTPTDLLPSLVQLTPQGEEERFLLTKAENWLGRDAAQCTVVLGKDPLVSPRHARLYRDAKNRWHVKNSGSLNGTWLRISKIPIDGAGQFQLGEQRFLVRIL